MLEELLAQIQAQTSSGMSETGLELTKTAEGEQSALRKYFNLIRETGSEAETEDIGRKRRRSKFRLGGSLLGAIALTALTGGASAPHLAARLAAGAGGGSLLGSKYAQSTQPGGWRLKGVAGLAPTGMFFGAGREKAGGEARDLQRYLTEANKSFDEAQYANALTDAMSAYKLATLPKFGNLFKGKIPGEIIDDVPTDYSTEFLDLG
jgi:hypothetical protein